MFRDKIRIYLCFKFSDVIFSYFRIKTSQIFSSTSNRQLNFDKVVNV